MSRYKSRKFLSAMGVFAVGLIAAATGLSVSGVEMVDAVGTWTALGAPLVFVVMEALVDRMAVALRAQQQVLKFQAEGIEMARQLNDLRNKYEGGTLPTSAMDAVQPKSDGYV